MKKLTTKLTSFKANTSLTCLLSSAVVLMFGMDCLFFFYEPKRPEGFEEISIKDLLPQR